MQSTPTTPTSPHESNESIVRFGEFHLDFQSRSLARGADSVILSATPFNTLEFLVRHRHRVVPKSELLKEVWGGFQERNTVEQAIGKIRKALGEGPTDGRYIKTVPRQGYRFVAEVHAPPVSPTAEMPPAGVPSVVEQVPIAKRSSWRAGAISLVGLSVAIFGFFLAVRLAREPNPQQVTVLGSELTAFGGGGEAIWHYQFPRPLMTMAPSLDYSLIQNSLKYVGNLTGDGNNEVVIAAAYGPKTELSDELYCFAPGGRLLWRYRPDADFSFVGRRANGPWKAVSMSIVPDAGNTRAVWVAFSDPVFAPTIIASVDAAGRSRIRYVSSGNVHSMTTVVNQNGTFLLAGGINNEYRAASLAVLDTSQPTAVSPQSPGNRFQCVNCPKGRPRRFLVLPRSELSIASGTPYNWVSALFRRNDAVVASVMELRVPADGLGISEFIELTSDFTPKTITFGAGYKEAHDRFESLGKIKHSWSDCQEQKRPAVARTWDESHGWTDIQIPWVH